MVVNVTDTDSQMDVSVLVFTKGVSTVILTVSFFIEYKDKLMSSMAK